MTDKFGAELLDTLRTTNEVRIIPTGHRGKGIIIWVVVAGEDVFIRSVQGPKGRWYRSVSADGLATLGVGDRQMPVHAKAVSDPDSIERVSREYLSKYSQSPYATAMVRPEVLETTLHLEPAC